MSRIRIWSGFAATGRRILIKKHAVAVPAETEPTEFASQVHAEAMRLGLAAAKKVYVVQDGAIWLWNVFEDRFSKCAAGTLDFYHASDHLWALAQGFANLLAVDLRVRNDELQYLWAA